jgi:hypothetical protein
MKLAEDYTLDLTIANRPYGKITVPKGTKVLHQTAIGKDENYHFVDDFNWIKTNYAHIAFLLKHDIEHYGLNIPVEYIEKEEL